MTDIKKIADEADMIINGYAFTQDGKFTKVLNLNAPKRAAVMNDRLEMVESTMDDIELEIVTDYLRRNQKYMELLDA